MTKETLKVFVCSDFVGHWPVGTAAVMVAEDEDEAWVILKDILEKSGLPQTETPEILRLSLTNKMVLVLNDGNY